MVSATIIVMCIAGVIVGIGLIALATRGSKKASGGRKCGGSGCGCKNRGDAEFCSRCGAKLP